MHADILKGSKSIAAFLGFSERTVRAQAEYGRLPVFKIGAAICARKSTLLSWIAEQERKNVAGLR